MMRKQTVLLILCSVLLLSSCGRTASIRETSAVADTAQAQSEPDGSLGGEQPSGVTDSDVLVCRMDGETAPGLRAEDAQTVKQLLAAQTWGHSYNGLCDCWIKVGNVVYAYETTSGILTDADDQAAKLSKPDRLRLNAILEEYLPGYDAKKGFDVR